jgi:CheY-like chemotaxis protein
MVEGANAERMDGRSTRPHVLIVSDDPELQAFLAEGLLYAGFWTSVIASAIQTLEVFRLRSFDLVLVDAALAGLGGLELVRRLRSRSDRADNPAPRTDVPILVIAGTAGEVTAEAASAAGADGVLLAPIELDELAPALHAVVADWRAAHPGRPWADVAALADGDRGTDSA